MADDWRQCISQNYRIKKLLQRYIVSTLGFSIFPSIDSETTKNEVDQGSWYSEEHECNWEGIMCDADMKVTSIQMSKLLMNVF